MNNFCFFIISAQKNVLILNYMLEKLNKYSGFNYEIYVSLDSENLPEDIRTDRNIKILLNKNGETTFGNRIVNALSQVPYKNVLVMCDDFIVEEEIAIKTLHKICEQMNEDESITNVILSEVSGEYLDTNIINKYNLRPQYGELKTSLQSGLWNRIGLMYLMDNIESPWSFESFANYKTYASNNKFYALVDNKYKPIVYNGGYFVVRGKIVPSELERLEKKFGEKIKIDNYPQWNGPYVKDPISFMGRIKRRINITIEKAKFYLLSKYKTIDVNKEVL